MHSKQNISAYYLQKNKKTVQTLKINPFFILLLMAGFAAMAVVFIYFLKQIWFLGMILSPIILIIAFFIEKKAVLDHFKNLGTKFWENPFSGAFNAVLTFVALPLVSIYILIKSIFYKKIGEMQQQNPFDMFGNHEQEAREQQIENEKKNPSVGEYIDYEEI